VSQAIVLLEQSHQRLEWIMIPPTNLLKKHSVGKNGKGTSGFHYTMNMMTKNGNKINGKSVEKITEEHNTMLYYVVVKGVKKLRNTTTGSFIKKYSKGTYVVTVKGHAFTIKDGVVIGNVEDGKKMKKHIDGVWKIG
jgi:hypothetical protein